VCSPAEFELDAHARSGRCAACLPRCRGDLPWRLLVGVSPRVRSVAQFALETRRLGYGDPPNGSRYLSPARARSPMVDPDHPSTVKYRSFPLA
jgi:hypothetical protein